MGMDGGHGKFSGVHVWPPKCNSEWEAHGKFVEATAFGRLGPLWSMGSVAGMRAWSPLGCMSVSVYAIASDHCDL